MTKLNAYSYSTSVLNISCLASVQRRIYGNWSQMGYTFLTTNFTIVCNLDTGVPSLSFVSPLNKTVVGNPFNISCNASDDYPLKNFTIRTNVTGLWVNNTVYPIPENKYTHNIIHLNVSNGKNITFRCDVWDTNNKKNYSSDSWFYVNDLVKPNISYNPSDNNTNYSRYGLANLSCFVWDNLSAISNVSLWTNFTGEWKINQTLNVLWAIRNDLASPPTFQWFNITRNLTVNFTEINLSYGGGYYSWSCGSCDASGNCQNNALNMSLFINVSSVVVTCPEKPDVSSNVLGIPIEWFLFLLMLSLVMFGIGHWSDKFIFYIYSGSINIILGINVLLSNVIIKNGETISKYYCSDGTLFQTLKINTYTNIHLYSEIGIILILMGLFTLLGLVIEERKKIK
jgi:hypothetical protein